MKKVLIAAALIGVVGFAGTQIATARGNYSGVYGGCGNCTTGNQASSEENAKAYQKFLDETGAIRKDITVKGNELSALDRQDNPDEKKVAKLTGELYDLNTELNAKAEANGIDGRFARGPGMMWNNGCNHMMGW